MTDQEEQDDELMALSEILETHDFCHQVSDSGLKTGVMSVNINTETGVRLITGDQDLTLHHLPPVSLHFTLPPHYPSQQPPHITLSSPWLHHNHLQRLEQKLLEIYSEFGGCVILFSWLSFLQEELLTFLGWETEINISDLCSVEEATDEAETSSSNHKQEEVSQEASSESVGDELYLFGTVKKWKQFDEANGHGFLRTDDGREWGFHSRDCLDFNQRVGRMMFEKGDAVRFREGEISKKQSYSNRGTLRAIDVEIINRDDVSELARRENTSEEQQTCDKCDIVNVTDSIQHLNVEENSSKTDEPSKPLVRSSSRKTRKQLLTLFRDFNQLKKDELFSTSLQSCDICYTDKLS